MPASEHIHELIQKYLDALASEAELAELEQLLATDPEVAHEFAEMARLHANLQDYFRKQYKMDQVAALLNAPEPSQSAPVGKSNGESGKSNEPSSPLRSTFTPRYTGPVKSRRGEFARHFDAVVRQWKPFAVAVLILVMGVAFWSARNSGGEQPRLISGRVAVAGRNVTQLADNAQFEVMGHEAAVIELPGGARIELVAATRATIRREANQFVVKLASGGGDFRVQPDQPSLRVETVLGVVTTVVTTNEGQFSLDLVTTLPKQVSSTMPIQVPRLAVVVVQGTVTVERAGISTTLSAGQEHIFLNSISS
jgi:ferric-dicitrate binding protein FerR (iron transport regulator)